MKLDPALTFAGLVVDEQGVPVPNARVTMECYAFENDSREAEHVAFNSPDAAAVTDAAGAFRLPYVPREIPPARGDSTEVQLKLDAEGFQVTQTNFPVPIMARHDLKLVIRKGFVVAGRVVDPQGRPVANVAVRELHNFGVRKLRTRTDQDGCFTLAGVFCVPSENEVRVVVEPEDWACQEKRLRLDAPTNVVEFTLVRSPVFRGQVVNEDGFPLAEVTIRTDSDNQGIRKYEWLDVTNIDGYFEWASAPAEPTLFWFEKDGYEVIRERVITPDGTENKITLRRIGSSRNAAYPVGQPKVTYRFYEPGARPER
jgi:hypothetical protein